MTGDAQECKAAAPSVAGDTQAVLDCRTDLILTGDRQLAFANMRHAAVSADLRRDLNNSSSSDDNWRVAAASLAAGAGTLLLLLLVLLACRCCRRRGANLEQSASQASADMPLSQPRHDVEPAPAVGDEFTLTCDEWESEIHAKVLQKDPKGKQPQFKASRHRPYVEVEPRIIASCVFK